MGCPVLSLSGLVDINKVKVIGQGDGYKMRYITSVGVSGCPPNPMGVFCYGMEKDKEKEGVFLWDEMLLDDRLSLEDVVLLSLYKSYTVYGKDKCCHMTGEQILEKLGNKMTRTAYQRAKRHLKELGLIECNGIVVMYKGLSY